MLTDEIKEALSLREKTLLITIGNSLRSDDGVGPYIWTQLRGNKNLLLLNGGDRPENIIDEAISYKVKRAIFIDAADFGATAGEIRLIPREHIPEGSLSTHTFPLPILARILEEDSGAKIYFLGVQPQSVAFGEALSAKVKEAADLLISYLQE